MTSLASEDEMLSGNTDAYCGAVISPRDRAATKCYPLRVSHRSSDGRAPIGESRKCKSAPGFLPQSPEIDVCKQILLKARMRSAMAHVGIRSLDFNLVAQRMALNAAQEDIDRTAQGGFKFLESKTPYDKHASTVAIGAVKTVDSRVADESVTLKMEVFSNGFTLHIETQELKTTPIGLQQQFYDILDVRNQKFGLKLAEGDLESLSAATKGMGKLPKSIEVVDCISLTYQSMADCSSSSKAFSGQGKSLASCSNESTADRSLQTGHCGRLPSFLTSKTTIVLSSTQSRSASDNMLASEKTVQQLSSHEMDSSCTGTVHSTFTCKVRCPDGKVYSLNTAPSATAGHVVDSLAAIVKLPCRGMIAAGFPPSALGEEEKLSAHGKNVTFTWMPTSN